jgi:OOP family OmpA-OmpF porin
MRPEAVMRLRTLAAMLMILAAALPVRAQGDVDVEGSKDHPMLSRFPGYYISDYDAQDFSVYEFDLGDKQQKVDGRYWQISYWLKENARKGGPVEIARNYANLFTQRGGVKLIDEVDAGGGRMVIRMPAGGKNIWAEISVSNEGETYDLIVVEEAGMAQQVQFTAMELAKILDEKGSVALRGILFDTATAIIKDESKGELQAVGELLKQQPALRLEIQGHTDNLGAAAFNKTLSEARAAAVKQYVMANFSIAADRLTTSGFGDTKPVGDNATDAGRAQNRRVELIKK